MIDEAEKKQEQQSKGGIVIKNKLKGLIMNHGKGPSPPAVAFSKYKAPEGDRDYKNAYKLKVS
jgi:hypothetical protein